MAFVWDLGHIMILTADEPVLTTSTAFSNLANMAYRKVEVQKMSIVLTLVEPK